MESRQHELKTVKSTDKTSTNPDASIRSFKLSKNFCQKSPLIFQPSTYNNQKPQLESSDALAEMSDNSRHKICELIKNFTMNNNNEKAVQSPSVISYTSFEQFPALNISEIEAQADSEISYDLPNSFINASEERSSLFEEGMLTAIKTPRLSNATKQLVFHSIFPPSKLKQKVLVDSSIDSPSLFSSRSSKPSVQSKIEVLDSNSNSLRFFEGRGYLCAPSIQYSDQQSSLAEAQLRINFDGFTSDFFSRRCVKLITCGYEHSLLLNEDGSLMAWGNGDFGCLGLGNLTSFETPMLVESLNCKHICYIEAGAYHNLALSSDGELYTWGRGDAHQLGIPLDKLVKVYNPDESHLAIVPHLIGSIRNAVGGACGEAHTLIIDSEGTLYSFGWAEEGQLGRPSNELEGNIRSLDIQPVRALSSERIVQVSAGGLFSLCLSEKGEVFSWGNGQQGQLGRGSQEYEDFPRPVEIPEKVLSIQCGESNAICVTANGTIYGWGLGVAGDFCDDSFASGTKIAAFRPIALRHLLHSWTISLSN